MAQEPSSKDLLEAVKQQESGGRRYKADGKTLLEGPQTKYGTAKGEMQVLDMTNKDPGYGVKPAQDDSPDERARVGRDYLNAMVKKYGNRETALVAYNWGPGNTDKWLDKGGDFSKLPKETQNYVTKITGALGSTKVAQATPTQKSKAGVQRVGYKAASVGSPLLSQLGPSYQAAMAVSMLADEAEKEGKDENEPSEAEKMLAAMPSKPAPVVDLDLGYQSPFPEIQAQAAPVARKPLPLLRPVRMAEGGDVNYFQDPFGVPDSGPVTADTLSKGKEFKAAEALQVLKDVGTNAASNLESLLRGAVSQVPGVVGDLESGGRQLLNFSFGPGGVTVGEKTAAPTSSEIRARVPRITATRPESSGMESMGELMAPGLAKTVAPVAKAAAKGTAKEMLRGIEGQGVLAPISPQGAIMYAVPPERPFVGRLDEFVDTIKNPVQLGQLKGQLKGKFRDYDLERVERAFTGMDDKTKLTPDQIKQALAETHSPSRWVSETRPPEAGKFHQNQDNVWGVPLGTTNLYLEQPPEKAALSQLFSQAAVELGRLGPKSPIELSPNFLVTARNFLAKEGLAKVVPPEVIQSLNAKLDKVEPSVTDIKNKSEVLHNIRQGMLYPVLYKNPEVAQGALNGQPFFRFTKETQTALEKEAIAERVARGMDRHQAFMEVHTDKNVYRQIQDKSQRVATKKVYELVLQDMQNLGIPEPEILREINWDTIQLPPGVSSVDELLRSIPEVKLSLDNVLEPAIQQIHEADKRVKHFLSNDINAVGIALDEVRPYEGGHRAITRQPYPIGFTRFSEHEANIPGMGAVQGRHFHELQSDLSKDMRATGSTYGNAAKDQAEYNRLNEEIRKIRYQSFPDTEKFSDINELNKAQNKWEAAQDTKIQSMEKRIKVLGERVRGNPSYKLDEPFAGFETNQMVRQQLLMKNAIQAAMRDGKSFATFPGNESAKPQLYAGKILPNLKQIIKDLGGEKAGLELRQIELPPDKNGRPITATGVVWSPEAAARISEKGVPFARGGMVERQVSTARYI